MIQLQPISRNDRDRVDHIAVLPSQEPFCGTIAHHFTADEPECDFHIILRDEEVVGFFKIDRSYFEKFTFAAPHELGLRGVMIDQTEQGKGTGKAAILALRDYLPAQYPWAEAVVLTVNEVNPAAVATYLAAGFQDTGAFHYGGKIGRQHIMRMPLRY